MLSGVKIYLLAKGNKLNTGFEAAIKARLGQNQGTWLDTESATGSHSKKSHIFRLGVVKKFEEFVHENRSRRGAHAMINRQNWADFESRISRPGLEQKICF